MGNEGSSDEKNDEKEYNDAVCDVIHGGNDQAVNDCKEARENNDKNNDRGD